MLLFLPRAREGFTLVEMAVVLVVIALIVGGIVTGQSMIRGAALKSVVTDFTKYQASVVDFRKKYGGLPGDMIDATDFWGTATSNGDGNGHIGEFAWTNTQIYEIHRAWQHLSLGGFITGSYTGVAVGSPAQLGPNVSEPGTKILSSAAWRFHYIGTTLAPPNDATYYAGDTTYFAGSYGNTLELVRSDGISPLMTPEEAWNIDNKLDDGAPGTGNVLSQVGATCSSSATAYNMTNKTISCFLTFRLGQ